MPNDWTSVSFHKLQKQSTSIREAFTQLGRICAAAEQWRKTISQPRVLIAIRRNQSHKVETMILKGWRQTAEISNIEVHELSGSAVLAQFQVSHIDLDKKRMQTRTECCWAHGKGGRGEECVELYLHSPYKSLWRGRGQLRQCRCTNELIRF